MPKHFVSAQGRYVSLRHGTILGVEKPVSRLVVGTMITSSRERHKSVELLDTVFEQGGNPFDRAHAGSAGVRAGPHGTAETYGERR
jgi:aryl-alcohol dehydrogenase-like predicted oxidoreductase